MKTIGGRPAPASAMALTLLFLAVATATSAQTAAPDTAALAPAAPAPSLTMEEAVARALASSEALEVARQEAVAAAADIREARAGRLPTLDLSGRYARNLQLPSFFLNSGEGGLPGVGGGIQEITIGAGNEFQASADAALNLWTAGRVSSAIRAAEQGSAAAAELVEVTASQVRYGVKEAYLGTLLAAEQVGIARASLGQAEEAVRVARARYEQGTSSRFDRLRAEVELANRRPPLAAAENDLEQALAVLRRRVGLPPASAVALADSLVEVAGPQGLEPLLALALAESPALEARRRQVASRRQLLALARADRWPALQLSGSYQLQGQWDEGLTPPEEQVAASSNVAVGLRWPIFDGFATGARIDRAEAELRAAEQGLAEEAREQDLTVRQAWLALQSALASLEGRRENVRLAEETYRIAVVRLENGLATPLERLDAEVALTTARAQLAAALHANDVALAQLELAVGLPLPPAGALEGDHP